VEILWWLVPSVAVTLGAMVWAAWMGREGRGEVDRDVAVERLAKAMARGDRVERRARPARVVDRSTGIAVRPTRRTGHEPGATRRVS
jgi:hypothetical protein